MINNQCHATFPLDHVVLHTVSIRLLRMLMSHLGFIVYISISKASLKVDLKEKYFAGKKINKIHA